MKKTTTKKVVKAVRVKSPTIVMTVKQAQTIQKALGTKSYSFLDKKVAATVSDSIKL